MANAVKQEEENGVVYFTQKELALRWRVTEATIKSIRDRGEVLFFFPPGSSRVLYPRKEILAIEREQLISTNKEKRQQKKRSISKMKQPVVSVQSTKEWRI